MKEGTDRPAMSPHQAVRANLAFSSKDLVRLSLMENPIPGQRWRAKKNPDFIVEVETITRTHTQTSDETTVRFSEPGDSTSGGTFKMDAFLDLYEMV